MSSLAVEPFKFSKAYSYPPFWTIQRIIATRHDQFRKWTRLILSYCRHHRLWRLTLADALNTPLFHNSQLRRRLTMLEVREILDWMTSEEGTQRAKWIGKDGSNCSAWIYWRRPEEWGEVIAAWVEKTGQKNTVLTLYELIEGEATTSQDFYGMDQEILHEALQVLVKRGKAQVFGSGDQQGVKFF